MDMDDFHRRLLNPTPQELTETISIINSLTDTEKKSGKESLKEINNALRVVIRDNWHTALEGVFRARGNAEEITILSEQDLGVDPDRMDYLILKKKPGVDFDGPAFRHFKSQNILEYKGGRDRVTKAVVMKTASYGYSYCTQPKVEDPSDYLTLNILCETKEGAINGLKPTRVKGVYRLPGYTIHPLYVIILEELKGKNYAAYRAISAKPDEADVMEVFKAYNKDPENGVYYGPLFKLVANKAPKVMEKVRKEGGKKVEAIFKIFEPEIQEMVKEEKKETAKRMIEDGKLGFEDIQKYTGLTLREVQELAGVKPA